MAYQPPSQFRVDTGSDDRATRAPIRRYPTFSAVLSGRAYTGDATFKGTSFGPSAGGTGMDATGRFSTWMSNGVSSEETSSGAGDARDGASTPPREQAANINEALQTPPKWRARRPARAARAERGTRLEDSTTTTRGMPKRRRLAQKTSTRRSSPRILNSLRHSLFGKSR